MGPDDAGREHVIDLMQLYGDCYAAETEPVEVYVPPRMYVMTEISDRFRTELLMLRRVAEELQGRPGSQTYTKMPIEGLWWRTHPRRGRVFQGQWHWVAGVCLPPTVSNDDIADVLGPTASAGLLEVKGLGPALKADELRGKVLVKRFGDGHAAQALHYGRPESAQATIGRLQVYVRDNGHQPSGLRHEIYLTTTMTQRGDMETIIRQPFQ